MNKTILDLIMNTLAFYDDQLSKGVKLLEYEEGFLAAIEELNEIYCNGQKIKQIISALQVRLSKLRDRQTKKCTNKRGLEIDKIENALYYLENI